MQPSNRGPWALLGPAGTFKLTLEFSEDYPNKAPVVKFKSTMFHPNSEWLVVGDAEGQPFHAMSIDAHAGAGRCTPPPNTHTLADTHPLSTMQSMLMEASAWTFCKTSGAPSMMCQQS